jgi:glycosyltransferase involved in cell wall biosynthesis
VASTDPTTGHDSPERMPSHAASARDAPFISILTPSYNYARYLPDALLSVARQQTEGRVEHVVVDDGSSDDSVDVLRSWREPLVVAVKENEGQSATLNAALALASGTWIGWLNADDFYLPGALSEVERLASTGVDVVHGDAVFVDARGCVLRLTPGHEMHAGVLRRHGPFMHVSSIFIRKSLLTENAWDTGLRQLLDWDLWLRLAREGARFSYTPRILSAFRWHSGQVSANVTARDAHEYTTLSARFGVPPGDSTLHPSRIAGKLQHAMLKAKSGAYFRQWRVSRVLKGSDVRWFEDPGALRRVETLLSSPA